MQERVPTHPHAQAQAVRIENRLDSLGSHTSHIPQLARGNLGWRHRQELGAVQRKFVIVDGPCQAVEVPVRVIREVYRRALVRHVRVVGDFQSVVVRVMEKILHGHFH